jgi:hypothetical protein
METEMKTSPEARIEIVEENGEDVAIYVVIDGLRVAKRGDPETPQAGQWVSLEPGWVVQDGKGGVRSGRMIIEYNDVMVQ